MISEGLQKLIGRKSTPIVFEVNRTDIRKIADAAGDRNPLYRDDEYASNSRYGGIIAPPDFFGWPVKWAPNQPFVYSNDLAEQIFVEVINAGYTRAINAGMESEYFRPIRPGDSIVVSSEVISIVAPGFSPASAARKTGATFKLGQHRTA